jgi:hypothetical protein
MCWFVHSGARSCGMHRLLQTFGLRTTMIGTRCSSTKPAETLAIEKRRTHCTRIVSLAPARRLSAASAAVYRVCLGLGLSLLLPSRTLLGKKDHPARLEISNNATAERAPYLTRLPLVPDYIPPQYRTIFRFAVRQREEFH